MAASYYSPLFNNAFPLSTNKTPLDRVLATRFRGMRKRAAIMKALNGAAPGATAQVVTTRVAAGNEDDGGSRPIETVYLINRATTGQDVAYNNLILDPTSRINTPDNKANLGGRFTA